MEKGYINAPVDHRICLPDVFQCHNIGQFHVKADVSNCENFGGASLSAFIGVQQSASKSDQPSGHFSKILCFSTFSSETTFVWNVSITTRYTLQT